MVRYHVGVDVGKDRHHVCVRRTVHADPDQAAYDEARTRCLEERGYRVLRFQAREVDKDLTAVVRAIREACEAGRN